MVIFDAQDRHGLSETVAEEGVDGSTLNGNRIAIDGKCSKFTFSFGKIRAPYWLPRDGFVSILEKAARQRADVDLREGWEVTELRRVQEGEDMVVEATLQGPGGEQQTMRPFLVVGADGLRSVVRSSLSQWAREDGSGDVERFDMEEKPSPAGGLRYKVLKLNASFDLPAPPQGSGSESGGKIEAEESYTFTSRYVGSLQHKDKETRLGLLPLKAKYAYRTANIITWPDHSIWTNASLSTLAGMQAFLRDSYPQVPWDQAVTEEELARFAASPGGRFPLPQTTKGGAVWAAPKGVGVGVALVGDALHAFPPDLGQGVNSALKDVGMLGDALRNATRVPAAAPAESGYSLLRDKLGQDAPVGGRLATALSSYEVEATGEAKALVRMMQLGSPYQYRQPGLRAQIAAKLMAANTIFRLLLSKIPILGGNIFFPQLGMLSQLAGNLSYREMLTRAHRTSFALAAVAIACTLSAMQVVLPALVNHTVSYWTVFAMWCCLFKALGF